MQSIVVKLEDTRDKNASSCIDDLIDLLKQENQPSSFQTDDKKAVMVTLLIKE